MHSTHRLCLCRVPLCLFGGCLVVVRGVKVVRFVKEMKTAASTKRSCLFADDAYGGLTASGTDEAQYQVFGQMAGFVEAQVNNPDVEPPYFCYGMLDNVLVATVFYCDSVMNADSRVYRFIQLRPHGVDPSRRCLAMGDFKSTDTADDPTTGARTPIKKCLVDAAGWVDGAALSAYYTLTRQVARLAAEGPLLAEDEIPRHMCPGPRMGKHRSKATFPRVVQPLTERNLAHFNRSFRDPFNPYHQS